LTADSGGVLGDQLGRVNVLCPTYFLMGLTCLLLWLFERNIHTMIAFVAIYGFFSGMFGALLPTAVSQLSPDEKLGARMGAFYSLIAVASLIGPPIGGSLIRDENTREGYKLLIIYTVITML
jgi:MFS transporter, MCT family, solute carrier family 16 (monocarboxylic acid transporters), member 10